MAHRIAKQFAFDAAHQLPDLPDGHKCGRLHGHTYTVEVVLSASTLFRPGFVVDFGELAPLKTYIDTTLDHRNLNDALPDVVPTSERLAEHLYWWCQAHLPLPDGAYLEAVRVSETPATWAEYRP